MALTITIVTPQDYKVFQRDGIDEGIINISGTYTGSDPVSVEADFDGGGYAEVDASPGSGVFSGTIVAQAAGQGTLTVRDSGNPTILDTAAYIGIGDVFLCSGQSNCRGNTTNSQSYSHATLKASMYPYAFVDLSLTWQELIDPTTWDYVSGVRNTNGSVWPLLATSVMAETGLPVAFINCGEGGTPISVWDPGHDHYNRVVAVANRADTNGWKALLWFHGESDSVGGTTKAVYKPALATLLDNWQANINNATSIKMVCGQNGYYGSPTTFVTDEELDAIRFSHSELWADDADFLEGPITYDINLGDEGGDGVHFRTDAEAEALAARWWRCIKYHFYSGADGLSPKFVSATATADNAIDVIFDNGVTGEGVTGWACRDESGVLTVSNVALVDSLTARLTVNRSIDGVTTIDYGSGLLAVDTSFYDSTGSPPTAFVNQSVGAGTFDSTLVGRFVRHR